MRAFRLAASGIELLGLSPLYHRSVRMYSLRSETNRSSGSAATVRAASIRTELFGGRSATTTQPMTPKANRAAVIIQGSRTMASFWQKRAPAERQGETGWYHHSKRRATGAI
jgi:hypothetical protein